MAVLITQLTFAQSHHSHALAPKDCEEMEAWDYTTAMCRPLAMADMPMKMVMLHFNSFFTQIQSSGRRGQTKFAIPNMMMIDIGQSIGERHYFNVELMATLERWTYPDTGYPLFLQIGEENQDHQKYIDAQHPHSSPIMGLTVTDSITLANGKDHFNLWLAPRGQTTDGPVAFMHRPTGMVNPDAPLGHHIGQDVGHITSTVLGASIQINNTTGELCTFNGTEPEPTKVDLPLGPLNSYSTRLIHLFSPEIYAMASAAFIKNPEPHEPDLDHLCRYSTSIYSDHQIDGGWFLNNAFIYGLINHLDSTGALNSFAEEIWLRKDRSNFWGRIEFLQRTFGELDISANNASDAKWVQTLTLGYTYNLTKIDFADLSIGGSISKIFLPAEFRPTYDGEPLTGKIFLQMSGMKMWELQN